MKARHEDLQVLLNEDSSQMQKEFDKQVGVSHWNDF